MAAANTQTSLGDAFSGPPPGARASAWPMIAFLSFIFAAPYLIMKMVGRPDTSKLDQDKDPRTWLQPIQSQAVHHFQASNPQELSVIAGEMVYVAPKEIQHSFRLMNTGWAMATKDFTTAGMVPINYLQRHQQSQQHIPRGTPPTMMAQNTVGLEENLMMNRVFDAPSPTAAPIIIPNVESGEETKSEIVAT